MTVTLVQSATGNTAGGASVTVTATFGATPTPGNLLVAVLMNGATNPTVTPWGVAADRTDAIAATARTTIYSKVAGAAEPAAVTATMSGSLTTTRLTVYEFASTAGLTWSLDKVAGNVDAGVAVTTLSSGTTAATTSTEGVAVAGFAPNGANTGMSLTNGYTLLTNNTGATGYLVLTATGTQETTATWTTARRVAASIATYKQAAASANTGSAFLALI